MNIIYIYIIVPKATEAAAALSEKNAKKRKLQTPLRKDRSYFMHDNQNDMNYYKNRYIQYTQYKQNLLATIPLTERTQ